MENVILPLKLVPSDMLAPVMDHFPVRSNTTDKWVVISVYIYV